MLPSTFYQYSMKNEFFLIDGNIYPIKKRSQAIKIDIFEKIYLTDTKIEDIEIDETKNYTLARFVIEELMEDTFTLSAKNKPVITKVFPKYILFNKGVYYVLQTDMRGKVRVAGKKFISKKGPMPVTLLEKKYQTALKKRYIKRKGLTEILDGGEYYSKEKNIGFLIKNKDFYAFTKVKPYALYERLNGKYYRFEEAKIGIRLKWVLGEIYWQDLKVLNSYTHPSLSQENKEFQLVCVGDYKYSNIKKKYPNNLKNQVLGVLKKGQKVLTTEYISSNKSWHKLIEKKFLSQEIKGEPKLKVLNY